MQPPPDSGHLTMDERRYLQEQANRFERAWDCNGTADIRQFLPPAGEPLRDQALILLIRADLARRWERGQVLGLEQYAEQFPELGPVAALPAALIHAEYCVRHRFGDRPALDTYRRRFPARFDELRALVEKDPPVVATRTYLAPPAAPAAAPPAPPTPADTAAPPLPAGSVRPPHAAGFSTRNPGSPLLPVTGGYKLVKLLGRGSFGEVWLAEAPGGFPAAIKVLSRPVGDDEAERELKSLELIKHLRHRCLVQTQAFWTVGDRLFVAMELADSTLRDRLKECQARGERGVPVPELLVYLRDAAEGLDYLHNQHVAHRDVKPENILLLQGHAKVADFGLARLQDSQRMATATASGTPLYMAPEVFSNKASIHSDQYSLAMTYAELRLGRPLVTADNMLDVMLAHLEGNLDLTPLPEAEQDVLRQALDRDPDRRFPSCLAFLGALEQAVAADPDWHALPPPIADEGGREPVLGRATAVDVGHATIDSVQRLLREQREGLSKRSAAVPGKGSGRASGARTRTKTGVGKRRRRPRRRRSMVPYLLLAVLLGVGGVLAWRFFVPRHSFEIEKPAPLTLEVGRSGRFRIGVKRDRFMGPINIHVANPPPGVSVPDVTVPGSEDQAILTATAGDVPDGKWEVQIVALAEGVNELEKETLELTTRHAAAIVTRKSLRLVRPEPLALDGGQSARLTIQVEREGVDGPVQIRFDRLPMGVSANGVTIRPGQKRAELTLSASPSVRAGRRDVQVIATADGVDSTQMPLDLTTHYMPAGCHPKATASLQPGPRPGEEYYDRLYCKPPAGTGEDVEFIFIPKQKDTPEPFYIMTDKVSVGLFRRFAEQKPSPVWNPLKLGAEYPALGIRYTDATAFAEWLGGKLPSVREWEQAAGQYEKDGREGPYVGKWGAGKNSPDIAVLPPPDANPANAAQSGRPRPVGAAKGDRSVYHCRDMAGNGLEWTRDSYEGIPGSIALRGSSYEDDTPYKFVKVGPPPAALTSELERPREDYGFRVVLEPPP